MITLALIIYKNTRKRNPPLLMHTCDSSSTWKKVQVNFHFYPISTEEDFYSELFTITAPSATAVAPNANTYVKYIQKTTTKAAQNTYQHNKKRLIRKNEFTSKVCGTVPLFDVHQSYSRVQHLCFLSSTTGVVVQVSRAHYW